MTNHNGNILVVDDNRMNRLKLSRGVQQHGYQVEVAESGSQAFDKLEQSNFDLILLDTTMPELDGFQVLQRLKAHDRLKQIPVIMLTTSNEETGRYLAQGAADYLPPNFDAAALKHCLETHLQAAEEPRAEGQVAILVVDDDEMNRLKLAFSLKRQNFFVKLAESGEQALDLVQKQSFDLVLLDVMMAGIDGFETCRRLKAERTTREIPVLFMTALTETEDKLRGFEVGAVDYITKPIQPEEVLARVNTHLRIRGLTQSLEEAYGLEQKRRQLSETLRQVAKIVSGTLDQDEVVGLVLDQLERVITYHSASVMLLSGQELIVAAGRNMTGLIIKGFKIPVDKYPLNAAALQKKHPILVTDVTQDPLWRAAPQDVPTRSFINAPLLVQNRPIGLLGVSRNDDIPYTNEEAQTVFAFGIQVAIAVENARLAQQTKISLHETEGLFRGARAILGSTELHEICEILTNQFKNLIEADKVTIYLLDTQRKQVTLTMNDGHLLTENDTHPNYDELMQGLSGQVITTGQPILSLNAYDGQESPETAQQRIKTGTGSIIVLPLITRDKVIGTATAINRFDQRLFTPHDVDLLMALANQAATALENVRLFNVARQANEELTKLNADKDKFFSILAHDLRGPFMPLVGYAQLLTHAVDKLSPNEIREMADSMYRSTKRVLNLLDNLLEWARLQMGRMEYNPEELVFNEIIERNIELLSANAHHKNITLSTTLVTPITVYGDAYMLDTVLRNLISNALKFTPVGGKVTVEATAEPQHNKVKVTVTDTGVGIPLEDIPKLFKLEVHYSTTGTAEEPGTGLGLIMCQEMIKKNGGDIGVESELGRGTTFTFTVPILKPEVLTPSPASPQPLSPNSFLAPPAAEIELLLDLAIKGNVPAIKNQVTMLVDKEPHYELFAEKLLALANQFEDEQIITMLKTYL